jgi:CheY-like chemotaxis protein
LRDRNIRVEVSAAGVLPEIEGDSKLLTQVFTNILVNAEQAISSTRDHGIVRISLSHAENSLVILFADDGPGIPQEIADKIFDPFFTTKRPGGGSGLGLTICLSVIKDHGGRIEVQSAPGGGTVIRVLLPAVPTALPESKSHAAQTRAASIVSPALSGHRLLIVDDEESIREIVEEGLSARGMIVESAGSSEEALSHLVANSYEIILCDFNLPGLNGEQLFEQLRAHAREAKPGPSSAPRFVFMTGDFLDPSMIASFSERGACVLQKPFHIADLAALLTELLQGQPVKL